MSALLSSLTREHGLRAPINKLNLDWFSERGVAPLTLLRDSLNAVSEVKVARCSFARHRFEFERHRPERECVSSFIFLARDYSGDLTDLVAWHISAGLASWDGRVALLGEEQVFGPRLDDGLPVHRDVMSWLRARRRGVVIVDPVKAPPLLRDAAPLEAADLEYGRELQKLCAVPLPRILVPDTCAAPVAANAEEFAA